MTESWTNAGRSLQRFILFLCIYRSEQADRLNAHQRRWAFDANGWTTSKRERALSRYQTCMWVSFILNNSFFARYVRRRRSSISSAVALISSRNLISWTGSSLWCSGFTRQSLQCKRLFAYAYRAWQAFHPPARPLVWTSDSWAIFSFLWTAPLERQLPCRFDWSLLSLT